MKYLFVTVLLMFASSAFAEGLDDAFKAALANSENDHVQQQVAFQVAPEQVEKATFKRVSEPHVVDVPAAAGIDSAVGQHALMDSGDPAPASVAPAAASDDMSAVEEEVGDMD